MNSSGNQWFSTNFAEIWYHVALISGSLTSCSVNSRHVDSIERWF